MKAGISLRAERWAFRLSLVPLALLGFIGIGLASQDKLFAMLVLLGIGVLGTWLIYKILCPIFSLFLKDQDHEKPRIKNSARTAHHVILIVTGLVFAIFLLAGLNPPSNSSPNGIAVFIVSGVVAQFTYFILGILVSLMMEESIWTPEETAMFSGGSSQNDQFNNPFHPDSLLNPMNPASPLNPDFDHHHHIEDIPAISYHPINHDGW